MLRFASAIISIFVFFNAITAVPPNDPRYIQRRQAPENVLVARDNSTEAECRIPDCIASIGTLLVNCAASAHGKLKGETGLGFTYAFCAATIVNNVFNLGPDCQHCLERYHISDLLKNATRHVENLGEDVIDEVKDAAHHVKNIGKDIIHEVKNATQSVGGLGEDILHEVGEILHIE